MACSIRLIVVAPLAAAALALGGCVVTPDVIEPDVPCGAVAVHPLPACTQMPMLAAESATYAQTQALPDFDSATYLVTDDAALAELDALLSSRVRGDVTILGDCDGGRTTELVVESATLGTVTVLVDTCTGDPLADDVDDPVSGWHDAGVGTPVP
ncbi:hypothetical protein [Agrococcus jejuensis]|uniref:Lipoprotein n=1 Tax=Agrococcus jejuensis TaxID=399736 RepID=A0A1G8F8M5_9MICO|nr:hypothetical protein [Agrococcus jejuensis]SDH78506.1 hypothetical protein SAMN04489720_2380 [Agrococcus jejuensis]